MSLWRHHYKKKFIYVEWAYETMLVVLSVRSMEAINACKIYVMPHILYNRTYGGCDVYKASCEISVACVAQQIQAFAHLQEHAQSGDHQMVTVVCAPSMRIDNRTADVCGLHHNFSGFYLCHSCPCKRLYWASDPPIQHTLWRRQRCKTRRSVGRIDEREVRLIWYGCKLRQDADRR